MTVSGEKDATVWGLIGVASGLFLADAVPVHTTVLFWVTTAVIVIVQLAVLYTTERP